MTADLAAWLTEQLDVDEQTAREAAAGIWAVESDGLTIEAFDGTDEHMMIYNEGGHSEADARHIVTWQPARVLAEIAAKRAVIEHELAYAFTIDQEWGCCHSLADIAAGQCPRTPLADLPIVRALAQPFAGRPGWQDEWADED